MTKDTIDAMMSSLEPVGTLKPPVPNSLPLSQFLAALPPQEPRTRAMSKDLINAQETIRRFSSETLVWYPVKTFKTKALAKAAAIRWSKAPVWADFMLESRGDKVFGRLKMRNL